MPSPCETPYVGENPLVGAVVHCVSRAEVRVDGVPVGGCGGGLLVLGVATGDDAYVARRLAATVARLRILPDANGRFDRSLLGTSGTPLL